MNNLVWKLLRHHVSIPQLAGFFFSNFLGMLIVLLGYQFYNDVMPVFTQPDSFMSSDYLIVSKQINAGSTISGRSNTFSDSDIADLEAQDFASRVGCFTFTSYSVDAHMGINGAPVLSSELFFESVPDDFIDVPLENWKWEEGSSEIPVILPRTYINMYNFGFAQSHSLPKISEGLLGMIDFRLFISGNGARDEYKGKVIGFSNRLNTILVPQKFMDWSNARYSSGVSGEPTRLIVKVDNPTDDGISRYMEDNGYDVEDDKLNAEKNMFFLKMVVSLVMSVGVFISVLSFYILMLSIYLLVQKNTYKLENLLLIGYSPAQVAMPYQLLTLVLNVSTVAIACIVVSALRGYYMQMIESIYPGIDGGSMIYAVLLGLLLFFAVTLINVLVIRRKVMHDIWNHKG
ncbi:MAG: ABC transporter permease [Prevotella sp.]|nr:ABC transporter permease [Prevotella sp.]